MVETLVTLIVLVVVLGLCWWLVSMLPLEAKLKQIVQVLFILLALVLILGVFFGAVPVVHFR